MVWVAWHDATAYARWAGKALPTAQQREKAARGPRGRIYPWGNEPTAEGEHGRGRHRRDDPRLPLPIQGQPVRRLRPVRQRLGVVRHRRAVRQRTTSPEGLHVHLPDRTGRTVPDEHRRRVD
ncbi:SUMF1/EgtB/PvdO family nonheme iron enzyme [Streptomyces sp. NPDC046985]|uniref:SUMF1/EgtB/PvdO family nonheme iron enzyme n=1 Tax=Streptomyces sp. NPDC046985 TaxID=3155377 RepID=UPI0033D50F40